MVLIQANRLIEFAAEILERSGALSGEARLVAESLVDANLCGYDSHGVMRLAQYSTQIRSGVVQPGAELSITERGAARIVANGNWGFGRVQTGRLIDEAIQLTKREGLCVATMHSCGHIGRLGEYCELLAKQGFVSILMVNSHGGVVRVAPPGGKAPRLSTNPIAIGSPNGDAPIILDISTSATAEGKVRVKKIAGERVPNGWLLDSEGHPTNDPNSLYANPPGSILPLGAEQSYKGFGLALMIEILTGALSGGIVASPTIFPKIGNCLFLLIADPAKFGGGDHFLHSVKSLDAFVRSSPTIDANGRIILPGEPERQLRKARLESGLELDAGNWEAICKLASELGVVMGRNEE